MITPDFTESSLRTLLETIFHRTAKFTDEVDRWQHRPKNPIYLRFDIDDDLRKAVKMADICYDYNINATFFILNTAKYWQSPGLMNELKFMQDSLGQEIGWHNNALTEWRQAHLASGNLSIRWIDQFITYPLKDMRNAGLTIRGSASHGDPLCRKLNYLNYEVFTECPRGPEASSFPPCSFTIPKVSMHDFGLEYEAYHVPYDLYLSESGGNRWTGRANGTTFNWRIDELNLSLLDKHDRIQVLIHPQHWNI